MTAVQLIKQFKSLPARERDKVAAYVAADGGRQMAVKMARRATRTTADRKVGEAPRGSLKALSREIALSNTFGDSL